MICVYLHFCLFFSLRARVFDVCWAREQGIGYTPQTGNEKFKQIDPCLWASERKCETYREECREIEQGRRWRMWNRHDESRGLNIQVFTVSAVSVWALGERRRTSQCIYIFKIDPDPLETVPFGISHPTEPIETQWIHLVHLIFSSQWYLFDVCLHMESDSAVFVCSFHLEEVPALSQALHHTDILHSTVVLMCQTATLDELIKQEKAHEDLSGLHKQSSCVACCSPFIWHCGCCFHGS